MAIFKCKMCGGTIEFEPGATVGTCNYCGTKQTLPRLDDDKKANLYDRANHFRRNNEFDKAMGIYEQILNEDSTDAEAYWSLVLCRYGIEYVEDPATHRRIPTVNRAQFTSVLADEDYKSALTYADAAQKALYEQEARTIDEIQKGILAISQKEEPFDVFICYKETDAQGRRTQDSVLATELYHELVREGFKVFFSRITLEDKLGTAYEPYIFAALNSAKVMVVLGTKAEHFNAVWVKNEWSRYLALIKNGARKMLIPAYRDMDPYDLPEEFSHLQAQDMSKLGFMQDLVRGIKKIVGSAAPAPAPTAAVSAPTAAPAGNVAPLLGRVALFLEDGKWQDANIYCEKVLDQDPKNAEAYLGKLMAELQVKTRKELANCDEPFDNSENYAKVLRFGNEALEKEMRGYIAHINDRNEQARLTRLYNKAKSTMNAANTEGAFKAAAETFASISGFGDSDALAKECLGKAEICRKDVIYNNAKNRMNDASVAFQEEAIRLFQSISGWKDADEQVFVCQKKIEEIKAKQEAARLEAERIAEERRLAAEKAAKKSQKIALIILLIVVACVIFVILLKTVIIPNKKYYEAVAMMDSGRYSEAIAAFEAMDGYKDSESRIVSCQQGWRDSEYEHAVSLMAAEKFDEAIAIFETLDGYKNSEDNISKCFFGKQKSDLSGITKGNTIKFGFYEQDNDTSNGKEEIEWQVLDVKDGKALVISKYALDCQKYNSTYTDVTWESCSLRAWLNDDFLNEAFGSKHQELIPSVSVSADKNPECRTNPGNATTDKVFLLSIPEAEKYFATDQGGKCVPTAYAKAQGAFTGDNYNIGNGCYCTEDGETTCWWWLRSPGDTRYTAAYVYLSGSVYSFGCNVIYDNFCVRPAMWISLE